MTLGRRASIWSDENRTPAARITDPSVSRHHARLRIVGDRATLEDLGSKNGTFVDDHPIASATRAGRRRRDSLRVGSRDLPDLAA